MQIVKGRSFYPIKTFKNLRDMIQESGSLYGQLDAFRFRTDPAPEPQAKTYMEFIEDYQALGSILLQLGLHGKRIAVIGENSYNWCVTHTAVLNGVGISVPLDRLLPAGEIISLLERGGVSAVFYQETFHEVMQAAVEKYPGQIELLCCMRPDKLKSPESVPFEAVVEATGPASADSVLPRYFRFADLLTAGRAIRARGDKT
ncbi:MAG: AMP-binding protein, partial [Bacillota bacterium]|nr:AMP-binding protein [Bacillota bacterium]